MPDTTHTIDLHPGTSNHDDTSDFTLNHYAANGLTWSQIRTTTDVAIYDENSDYLHAKIVASNDSKLKWSEIRRSFMSFDLTDISCVNITSAQLRMYGTTNNTGLGDCGLIFTEWYMSNGPSGQSISNWTDWNSSSYLNATYQSGYTTSGWNVFNISTSFVENKLGNYLGIAMLLGNDYNNSEPTWSSTSDSEIDGNSADATRSLTLRLTFKSSMAIYTGSNWRDVISAKIYTGSEWKSSNTIKIYTGSAWKST